MKNFRSISEIISYIITVNNYNNDLHIASIDQLANKDLRFKATHEIKDFEASIYNIPLERVIYFRSHENAIIAIHLFFKPTNTLVNIIETDLGNYSATASWGTEGSESLKIVSWNYDNFIVDLRKNVMTLDVNYQLLPPCDVITVSNDVYRKLK